ncbi:MAG: helix-turn-helix domain-containing protein [Hyphomicrobiales bacterium]
MSNFPMPGTPVRGSKTGVPIMALLDLFGRPWSLGVLWQLCDQGVATFRELQARCEGISPTVLNSRLKELKQAGLIETTENGYCATKSGREVFDMIKPLKAWSVKWAKSFDVEG